MKTSQLGIVIVLAISVTGNLWLGHKAYGLEKAHKAEFLRAEDALKSSSHNFDTACTFEGFWTNEVAQFTSYKSKVKTAMENIDSMSDRMVRESTKSQAAAYRMGAFAALAAVHYNEAGRLKSAVSIVDELELKFRDKQVAENELIQKELDAQENAGR